MAILEDDRLVELLVDRPDHRRTVGDIYLGRVEAVLPGIQAAFVDIGQEKSAFLHASDLLEPDEDEEPEDEADDDAETSGTEPRLPTCAAVAWRKPPAERRPDWRGRDRPPAARRGNGGRRDRETVAKDPPARDLAPPRAAQHPGHPQEGPEPPGPGHQGADRHQGLPGHRADLPPRPFPGLHALRLQGRGEPEDREPGAAGQAAGDGLQAPAQGCRRRHRPHGGGGRHRGALPPRDRVPPRTVAQDQPEEDLRPAGAGAAPAGDQPHPGHHPRPVQRQGGRAARGLEGALQRDRAVPQPDRSRAPEPGAPLQPSPPRSSTSSTSSPRSATCSRRGWSCPPAARSSSSRPRR